MMNVLFIGVLASHLPIRYLLLQWVFFAIVLPSKWEGRGTKMVLPFLTSNGNTSMNRAIFYLCVVTICIPFLMGRVREGMGVLLSRGVTLQFVHQFPNDIQYMMCECLDVENSFTNINRVKGIIVDKWFYT